MKTLFVLSQQLNYASQAVFQQALTSAGWHSNEYEITQDPAAVGQSGLKHRLIVAFGDGAARACLGGDWKAGWAAERRGYVWEGAAGCKVLTTLDPEYCTLRMDASGINGMLLVADLERGKKEAKHGKLERSSRVVHIVDSTAKVPDLRGQAVACDIECTDPSTLQCIGFAPAPNEAFVFVGRALPSALSYISDESISKTFQNGQFDVYFLKTRCGTQVASWTDDCMIAWHALWPEIAGKGARGSKRTRKSLAFLASLYTVSPEWWKDYDVAEAELYLLNGRDCCITYEIMAALKQEMREQNVEAIYQHEMSMLPALVAIQERGLLVDEDARAAAIAELDARASAAEQRIRQHAEPLLRERSAAITKPHLFFGKSRCRCCNGGKIKTARCWTCAGMDKAPGKKAASQLEPCKVCGGVGSFDTFDFNPASTQQQVELFYNVLGLPKHYRDGSVTVDEKSLKQALAAIAA